MKNMFSSLALGVLVATSAITVTSAAYAQQTVRTEEAEHPRIATAIYQMQDALAYLRSTPDSFGGHKEQAIIDTERAIASLKAAMRYKAHRDNLRGY